MRAHMAPKNLEEVLRALAGNLRDLKELLEQEKRPTAQSNGLREEPKASSNQPRTMSPPAAEFGGGTGSAPDGAGGDRVQGTDPPKQKSKGSQPCGCEVSGWIFPSGEMELLGLDELLCKKVFDSMPEIPRRVLKKRVRYREGSERGTDAEKDTGETFGGLEGEGSSEDENSADEDA